MSFSRVWILIVTGCYRNQVNDVDLYIGGLSEKPVRDGLFGPTFTCLLSHQFRDIKNGDRLWHENGGKNQVFTASTKLFSICKNGLIFKHKY